MIVRKIMEDLSPSQLAKELYASANEKVIEIQGDSKTSHFASLRLPCRNKEEFVEWLQNHQSMTDVTFRVKNVRPFKGITIVYKAEFRCQHNTYPDSHRSRNYKPSKQHTGCEASLKVTIKSAVEGRRVRSQDDLRADYPTIVQVNHNHNHEVKAGDYKGPLKKKGNKKKPAVVPSNSNLVAVTKPFLLDVCDVPAAATIGFELLPEIRAPAVPQIGNFFERTGEKLCFISQDSSDICYDWNEAEKIIADAAANILNFMKSRFSSDPSGVIGALRSFRDRVDSLGTESDLFAALRSFGGDQLSSVVDIGECDDSVEAAERGRSVKRKYEIPQHSYTAPNGTIYEILW